MSRPVRMTPAAWRGLSICGLCLGMIVALVGAGHLAPDPSGAWRSQPAWPLYGAGVFGMLVCVVAFRRHQRVRHGEAAADATLAVFARLREAVEAVREGRPAGLAALSSAATPLPLEVLLAAPAPEEEPGYLLWLKLQLDPILDDLFPRIMDGRAAFRSRHGPKRFAQVFSGLARAERLLLRAWSAAVDGYADEARQSLQRAADQLAHTAQDLV
jgi:hypothetical protein